MASNSSAFPAGTEAALWRGVGARWGQLFGDFNRLGVSFEWHELAGTSDVDWARSFHPDSLELCLNLGGVGEVSDGKNQAKFTPWTAGFYRQGAGSLQARRLSGEDHQFVTVEFAPAFLEKHLASLGQEIHPVVRGLWDRQVMPPVSVAAVETLSARQRDLVTSLRHPPVLAAAQSLWYQAKATELMGEFFFQPPATTELFCHRQLRVARDRVAVVVSILKRDPVNPPSLQEIGKEVGCSPFYLSRTFSKEMGQTIPQFIRLLRLERAAELLKSGQHNVTEVALEVGYNSLSHFSQAFHQHFGCCPGLYPMAMPAQQNTAGISKAEGSNQQVKPATGLLPATPKLNKGIRA